MTNPAALSAFAKGDMDNFLVASTPGGIEAQEKAGQALLVASTNMPKELRPSREAFEKVGFKFGADVDEIFVSATLPLGWYRQASDHSMWSYIMDEQGRKRAAIFYKAAFYDRRASASLERRIMPESVYPETGSDAPVRIGVTDCGKMIFEAGAEPKPYNYEARKKLDDMAQAWADQNYPDWNDPTAYW